MADDSFVFYSSFYYAIAHLSDSKKAVMVTAICQYVFEGSKPSLPQDLAPLFVLIKPQLDANSKKRRNGKKGGRPKKSENYPIDKQEETEEKPVVIFSETSGYEDENHRLENEKPNVNANVNANVNENVKGDCKGDIPTPAPPRRGTQLPDDWSLPQEWGEWAEPYLSGDKIILEADKFRDWAKANGAVKKDWEATWRNWVRRVVS